VPAVAAIQKFMSVTSLSNTNNAKILELEEELSTSLRDAIAGRDELDIAAFTEDESLALGHICTRFAVLAKVRNLAPCLEEDEGGKQSSAYDILTALADRGKLGYREEETVRPFEIYVASHLWVTLDGLGNVESVSDAHNMENEGPPFPRKPDAR
jgi:cohesin complex subunit SA-1/2